MNTGNFNKIIFLIFLSVNFISQGEVFASNRITEKRNLQYFSNSSPIFVSLVREKEELIIESKIQSEINNILYAEGEVSVIYGGKLLNADSLIYDRSNKKISAKGNISLTTGEQIFKMDEFEYDFTTQKGYLLDVKGSINTDKLISDLFENFKNSDVQKIENVLNFKRSEVLNTPNKVANWIFSTDKIIIEDQIWKSKKAIFTNDLLELNQIKIVINSLEAESNGDQIQFRSSLNYLILDEKVSIPFWFGDRTLTNSGDGFYFENRWNLGYDKFDKDGYFIGRKFNPIKLSDDFVLNLEPQFLIQRSLNGDTRSFAQKGDSINGAKIKRDTNLADYFALKSQIKGQIKNWDLDIGKQINSFDSEKFSSAFRLNTYLSKQINFLNSKWEKGFYGVYRDRIWNGSLGEAEIYTGYGSKLEKLTTWEVDGISKSEVVSIGLANLKAEDLNSKNLLSSFKINLFYALDQKIPISVETPNKKFVDSTFEYIPQPVSKGLHLNTRIAALYSLYEDQAHQEYFGFGLGPELTLGNFKKKTFDYTKISFFPFYKIKSGDSLFKFDQISDKFTLNIALDQQLFGPFILKGSGTLNLDNDSNDYGEFISSNISLNWKKRSYEFGIFYQPHNQAGGISFKLFGFK